MLTAIVLVLYVSALLIDSLTVRKQMKLIREKVVYYVMMLISFALLILNSRYVSIPSPAQGIIKVLDALFHINP
ncbi:MAG TPA: hypothetical protein GX499_04995 [Clostridiales bacterium]|jgi:succinate dehydrogenase hydrophobic anchor subunit|nr:hypothetical protein [Clostridiales bacterium]